MSEKVFIGVIIVLIAILGIFLLYVSDSPSSDDNLRTLNVSSEGPLKLSQLIEDIKTKGYYEGCDNETVEWMESLGNKQVVFENNSIVIMNSFDARKIPYDVDVTDAYVYNYFTAEIVENHDLGVGHTTVYYVKNVKFTGQEIVGNGLA